jgi:hypothetical protein
MHSRAFPLALFTLALAAPVAVAQSSDDSGQQPGGYRGRMHGPGRGTPPDPVVLKGPPAPADFQKLVELPQDKVAGYQGLYDRFMAETKPQRDSLTALRTGMGGSGDSGDRESFQQRREVFMPLSQELTRRQAAFDDALKDMLDKDQWKRYQKWRDEERKVAEQQRRDRWRRHRGAPPADGQPPT